MIMVKGSLNIVSGIMAALFLGLAGIGGLMGLSQSAILGILLFGGILTLSPRMVLEWEKGLLLRLGKFNQVLEPGITWIIPGMDMIAANVDMRVRTTSFSAEKALSRDTVPVDVDAVLFWVVFEAKRAILEVEQYEETINWISQTTLRDIIGRSDLSKLISDREGLDRELQTILDAKTSEWGITVQSVEIRDVKIPASLEDAMSRKAQADREKEARIILSQSETEVARQMTAASEIYASDPTSLQLRMMNMTYESVKEKGALMVVPSSMQDSLSGQVLGMAAAGFRHTNNNHQAGV
jgi:regulator of protease activity HflC (stomatin/prohibitin superfamily)